MAFVITANNRASRDNRAPSPAVKDDGSNYLWRMFYHNDRNIIDADGLDELINVLIPGYVAMDEEDRFEERERFLQSNATEAKVAVLSVAASTPDSVSAWENAVLSHASDEDYEDPSGWGDARAESTDEETPDVWYNEQHPLVLMETSYVPFTEVPKPISSLGDFKTVPNIVWLSPITEVDFLASLNRLGAVAFGTPQAAKWTEPSL